MFCRLQHVAHNSARARRYCNLWLDCCRELFKSLDTDKSNTVEAKELANGLKAQGYNISEQELQQLMGRVDFDRNGTLDIEEFISGLIDWNEVSHFQHATLRYAMICCPVIPCAALCCTSCQLSEVAMLLLLHWNST